MIPKKFHFIWYNKVEPNVVPPEIEANIMTFKRLHPEWQFHIWTNNAIDMLAEQLEEPIKEVYNRSTTLFAQKTDIIRMQILQLYGGVYVDCDMICIGNFNDLLDTEFFVGEEECKEKSHEHATHKVASDMHYINNAIIGSRAFCSVIDVYFELLPFEENKVRVSLGPKLVEKTICKHRIMYEDVTYPRITIYPHDYFYVSPYFKSINTVKLTRNSKVLHLYFGTSKDGI